MAQNSEPTAHSSREQLVSLKVMRLTRPTFATAESVPMEPEDFGYTEMNNSLKALNGQCSILQPFNHTLLLPQSFDNIYLGETFTFYVCLHNDSQQVITNACVKADLQTSSQRSNLVSKYSEPVHTLEPACTFGEVISYEVKECGQHILVCAVSYVGPNGERKDFRKFFKFPVAKPLDVRTKFYNADSDSVYFEAQMQNTCHCPIVMEKVALEPSNLYTVQQLTLADNKDTTDGSEQTTVNDMQSLVDR